MVRHASLYETLTGRRPAAPVDLSPVLAAKQRMAVQGGRGSMMAAEFLAGWKAAVLALGGQR
jgi:hypothetical protein